MEKKSKALGNNKSTGGDKERGLGLHRHGHGHTGGASHGSFHRSPSVSSRLSHGEPSDMILDPKSNKSAMLMRRPNSHPELLNREMPAAERTPWLNLETPRSSSRKIPPMESANGSSAKLLVNVTVALSIGPLRVLVSNEATVVDVIKLALALYAKEGRRPILSSDPLSFGLHFSQFIIDCLNPKDNIKNLGSRNFFLCPNIATAKGNVMDTKVSVVSCGTEMDKFSRITAPWYKVMDCFLLLP